MLNKIKKHFNNLTHSSQIELTLNELMSLEDGKFSASFALNVLHGHLYAQCNFSSGSCLIMLCGLLAA